MNRIDRTVNAHYLHRQYFRQLSEFIRSLRDEDIIVIALPALKGRATFNRSLRDEELRIFLSTFCAKPRVKLIWLALNEIARRQ
jgi:hypothetical protein